MRENSRQRVKRTKKLFRCYIEDKLGYLLLSAENPQFDGSITSVDKWESEVARDIEKYNKLFKVYKRLFYFQVH